jgi:CheY-like chemotaxis protein
MSRAFHFTVAEDDSGFLALMQYLLSRAFPASTFATFSNAADALCHIQHSGTDILITDHGMGTMTGTELIQKIRQDHNLLPIIMLSGDEQAEREALSAGANEFLHKDVYKQLVEHVKRYLPL